MSFFSHISQKIASAEIKETPYPYVFIERIFPEEIYEELLNHIPDISYFTQLTNYPKRYVLDLDFESIQKFSFFSLVFWHHFVQEVLSQQFVENVCQKFKKELTHRFGAEFSIQKWRGTLAMVRDQSEYSIGPHTDHPQKILTLLFYLPKGLNQQHLGTSIYIPKQRELKCEGLDHHQFEEFDKVLTLPFLPNCVFGFTKSDISFHGVEQVSPEEEERILLCYTLWQK